MNSKTYRNLLKAVMLTGTIGIGWAAHAQSSTTDNMSADSTGHKSMRRHWDHRNGSDSSAKRGGGPWAGRDGRGPDGRGEGFGPRDRGEGFRRGGEGFRRGGPEGRQEWAHRGGRGPRIHYTPEQRQKVMAINKDYRQKSSDLFKKDNITLKEYKAGLVALQKEKKSKLEALLTPKQKEEIAARKKRTSENMQVMAAARMERLKLRLNLSDDQVAKIKAGQDKLLAQLAAIRDNQDLLPQQKMEQLKGLAAKRQDTFQSVLTPEQLSKFQEMQHRPGRGRFGGDNRNHDHPLGEETK